MPIEFSEDLFQNDDFKVETDNNGDLVQTHKQTGAEFKFDSLKNRWVPVQGLDLGGATVDNVGSMDADSIDVTSLSATQLAQALDASGNDLNNVGAGDFDSVSSGSLSTDNLTTNGQSGVELPQDVTSSRSLGTWETNNTGNAIFVMIQLNVKDQDTDVNDRLRVATDVNSSQTANPVVDTQIQTSDGSRIDLTVTAMVPDGAEYRARIVKDDSNNASLGLWHEQKIGV